MIGNPIRTPPRLAGIPGRRVTLTVGLLAVVTWSMVASIDPGDVLHTGGLNALGQIVSSAFTPDLSPSTLEKVTIAAFRTFMYAVAGMSVALLLGIPLGIVASGVLVQNRMAGFGVVAAIRAFLAVLRAVHEIVWAVLFVFALGLSPVAGVLAIGIPYGGILGRIIAERITDVPDGQLDALRSSGASPMELLVYGRLPVAIPDLVSYLFYRLECAVRAAAVLSFVGLGGLGFRISIALDDLKYDEAWTSIYALVILVTLIDLWSAQVRRRLL